MRTANPISERPKPMCDYCGEPAALTRFGETRYPYRDDHGALWVCASCEAWIGVRARSTREAPLGRLANPALREAKTRLHAVMEPLVQAKMRRDQVNAFEARAKALRWAAKEIGLEQQVYSAHALTLDECERIIMHVQAYVQARADAANNT